MTPPVILGSLPSTHYSLKIISTVIMVFYIITIHVIVIYPRPILCGRDGRTHCSRLT